MGLRGWIRRRKEIGRATKAVASAAASFKKRAYTSLELIDTGLSQELSAALAALRESKKKRDKIASFKKAIDLAKTQNADASLALRAIEIFGSMEKALGDPEAMMDNEAALREGAEVFRKFRHPAPPHSLIYGQIRDFLANHGEIIRQYRLVSKLRGLIDLGKDAYLPFGNSSYLAKLQKELSESQKRYYEPPFPSNIAALIEEHNASFLERHMGDEALSDVGGRSLDADQRIAVMTDNLSTLLVAGAGCGKTTAICGKVKWLIANGLAKPEEILCLSYSRASAEDLGRRLSEARLPATAKTFHSFGLSIMEKRESAKLAVYDQFEGFIAAFCRERIATRPDLLPFAMLYLSMSKYETPNEEKDTRHYIALMKAGNPMKAKSFRSAYRSKPADILTLKREHVKSYEEMAIANWYFLNGIEYEYEAPYEKSTASKEKRQYLPDFYLPEAGIYHEHYGIDASGRAPQLGDDEAEYLDAIRWKRALHRKSGTVCLETTSAQFSDGTVFEKLDAMLKERGVPRHPLSDEELAKEMSDVFNERDYSRLIDSTETFLSLYKSRYRNEAMFKTLIGKCARDSRLGLRAIIFLRLCREIYMEYREELRKEGKIDFDDMILGAADILRTGERLNLKYVLVDEFQDISASRLDFLQAILSGSGAHLFAVGDDWQAIYRFAGCEPTYFLSFSEEFDDARILTLRNTHRYPAELGDVIEPFIMKNPEQTKRRLHSDRHITSPLHLDYYDQDQGQGLAKALRKIAEASRNADALLLGRYNWDIQPFADAGIVKMRISDGRCSVASPDYPSLRLRFMTIHGSKGLEADYVVLLNASDDRLYGFPSKMSDDPVMDLVLSKPSRFPFAEERRLFYVALSRARKEAFIVTPRNHPSLFVQELLMNAGDARAQRVTDKLCPKCGKSHLVECENADGTVYFRCESFPYCDYLIDDVRAVRRDLRCPVCGDFLITKQSRTGHWYMQCHNYRECHYRRNYIPVKWTNNRR